ncbi:hypothetical protein J4227_01050 [Candidatus Woesearchaeota archaeon]|nr:hypothetical protein [Candidatus Woesearchaeota archaeon]
MAKNEDMIPEEMDDMEQMDTADAAEDSRADSDEAQDNDAGSNKQQASKGKKQKPGNAHKAKHALSHKKAEKKTTAKHRPKHAGKAHVEKKAAKPGKDSLKVWLFVILGVVLVVNVALLYQILKVAGEKEKQATEAQVLPKLEMVSLVDSTCEMCFSLNEAESGIVRSNYNITGKRVVEYSSAEGKELIAKYGIQKIPTIVLTGETDKVTIAGFGVSSDGMVFAGTAAPYVNAADGQVKGLVTVTYLRPGNCAECSDLNDLISQLSASGIQIADKKEIEVAGNVGRMLVDKYAITMAPTLILSPELAEYPDAIGSWSLIGTVEEDGNYVIRNAQAIGIPYYDITTNTLGGLLDVTYIVDKSCDACYNVSIHRAILLRFGAEFGSETTVDVSDPEGKALIEKYSITKVPAIVMSGDAAAYSGLVEAWRPVGSVEEDGTFVFRNPQVMTGSIYKDLEVGQVLGQAETDAATENTAGATE